MTSQECVAVWTRGSKERGGGGGTGGGWRGVGGREGRHGKEGVKVSCFSGGR